jgi:hypothetical protein
MHLDIFLFVLTLDAKRHQQKTNVPPPEEAKPAAVANPACQVQRGQQATEAQHP